MLRVLDRRGTDFLAGFLIHPTLWTAVIPAAGRGTRFGESAPKALFPVAGKPVLQHIVDKVSPLVSKIVLVISPKEEAAFRNYIQAQSTPEKFSLAFQPEALGTVDAILCAESSVKTRHSLVVWADHYSVQAETIRLSCLAHEARGFASLTLPTCHRARPYISIERGLEGRIVRVLQARELSSPISFGENDCGTFCFRSKVLFETLRWARRHQTQRGNLTGEQNLLSLLPLFEGDDDRLVTLAIADASETLGMNTKEEAKIAEATVGDNVRHLL